MRSAKDKYEERLRPAIFVANHPRQYWSLEERMQYYRVPGIAIALLQSMEIKELKVYGEAKLTPGNAVDTDTLFQAASISKPVTAAAILNRVMHGDLSLDKDVNAYLKDWHLPPEGFAPHEPVTLAHILSHRGGLSVTGFDGYRVGSPLPTIEQILDGMKPANSPPVRRIMKPRSSTRYSGGGTTIAQKILQDVCGESFAPLMSDLVLERAGMANSNFFQPLPESLTTRLAYGHIAGRQVDGGVHVYPELAAAGLCATIHDLAMFVCEIQRTIQGKSDKIIDQHMARHMIEPQGRFGLGPLVVNRGDKTYFEHAGGNAGFSSLFTASTDGEHGFAILTNGEEGVALIREIQNAIADTCGWPGFDIKTKTAIQLSFHEIAPYGGLYESDSQSDSQRVRIHADEGALYCHLPEFPAVKLWPLSKERFFIQEDNMEFTFSSSASGSARYLSIERDGHELLSARLNP